MMSEVGMNYCRSKWKINDCSFKAALGKFSTLAIFGGL